MRYVEGEPIVKVSNFIPLSLCPDLIHEDLTDKSLYRTLFEKYHLRAFRAEITLEATVADDLDSKAVSYTHLDVYKRQVLYQPRPCILQPGLQFTRGISSS